MFLQMNNNTYRVCSTNALNPKCRFYQFKLNVNETHVGNGKSSILENALILNETSGIGFSPLRAYENKFAYNYVPQNNYLFIANTFDLNRYFTSINRLIDQDSVDTNVNDNNWLYSKLINYKIALKCLVLFFSFFDVICVKF